MPTYQLNPSVPSVAETGIVIHGVNSNSGNSTGIMWNDGTDLWYYIDWSGLGAGGPDFYGFLVNITTGATWIVPGPSLTTGGSPGLRNFCYHPTVNKLYSGIEYGSVYYVVEFDPAATPNPSMTVIKTPLDSNPGSFIVGGDGNVYFLTTQNVYSYNPVTKAWTTYPDRPSANANYSNIGCDSSYIYLNCWDNTVHHIYSCPIGGNAWTEWSNGTSDAISNGTGLYMSGSTWYVAINQGGEVYYSAINNVFTLTTYHNQNPGGYQAPSYVSTGDSGLDLTHWNYDLDTALLYPGGGQLYALLGYRTPRGSGSYTYVQAAYTGPFSNGYPSLLTQQNDGKTLIGYASPSIKVDYPTLTVTKTYLPVTPSIYGVTHLPSSDKDYLWGYPDFLGCFDPSQDWTLSPTEGNRFLPTDSPKPNPYNMPWGAAGHCDYDLFGDYDSNNIMYVGRNFPADGRGPVYGDVMTLNPTTGDTASLFPGWRRIALPNTPKANPTVITVSGGHFLYDGQTINFTGITQSGWTALNDLIGGYTATVINSTQFSIAVDSTGYASAYTQDANGLIQIGTQYRSLCANASRSKIVMAGNNGYVWTYDVAGAALDATPILPAVDGYPYLVPLPDGTILAWFMTRDSANYYVWRFDPVTRAIIFFNGPHAIPGTAFGYGTATAGRRQIKPILGPDNNFWMFFGNELSYLSAVDGSTVSVKDCSTYGRILFVNDSRDLLIYGNGTVKALANLMLKFTSRGVNGTPEGHINGSYAGKVNGVVQ